MLKITEHANPAGEGAILRLEGRVAGPWVDELRRVCTERRQHANAHDPLALDLRDVSFIDPAGIAFFDEISGEIGLINCSLFAAEQLKAVMERHHTVRR
jgi:anti-anti-sigma regulatory factor